MSQPLLGTGLSGLVGSRIVDLLSSKFAFENLDLTTGVDITNEDQVFRAVEKSLAKTIIHMAAFTNATAAWQQNGDKNGLCYQVNVVGTENIAQAAQKTGKHLIHLSTAFVFDGEKESMYLEDDMLNPIEWYGKTKALAEEAVQSMCDSWTIFRIDQPFRSDTYEKKPDTTHALINGIQKGTLHPQFVDHYFSPTVIEDFALALDWAISQKAQGIYHATCGTKISDYEYATLINETLNLGGTIQQGNLDEYLKIANRPYQRNTAMSSEKLAKAANINWTTLEDAVRKITV